MSGSEAIVPASSFTALSTETVSSALSGLTVMPDDAGCAPIAGQNQFAGSLSDVLGFSSGFTGRNRDSHSRNAIRPRSLCSTLSPTILSREQDLLRKKQ